MLRQATAAATARPRAGRGGFSPSSSCSCGRRRRRRCRRRPARRRTAPREQRTTTVATNVIPFCVMFIDLFRDFCAVQRVNHTAQHVLRCPKCVECSEVVLSIRRKFFPLRRLGALRARRPCLSPLQRPIKKIFDHFYCAIPTRCSGEAVGVIQSVRMHISRPGKAERTPYPYVNTSYSLLCRWKSLGKSARGSRTTQHFFENVPKRDV